MHFLMDDTSIPSPNLAETQKALQEIQVLSYNIMSI